MTDNQRATLNKLIKVYPHLLFKVSKSGVNFVIYNKVYKEPSVGRDVVIPYKLYKSAKDLDKPVKLVQDINELIFRSGRYIGLLDRAKYLRKLLNLDENNKLIKK